jgi:hypothetical protein
MFIRNYSRQQASRIARLLTFQHCVIDRLAEDGNGNGNALAGAL